MPRDKEFSDAILAFGEDINKIRDSLSHLAAAIGALQTALAFQMNPSDPLEALKQIQEFEAELQKLDPGAEKRRQWADALDVIRMIEKHGGPKHA